MENEQELRNIIAENEKRIMKERNLKVEEKDYAKIFLLAYILPKIQVIDENRGQFLLSDEDMDIIMKSLKICFSGSEIKLSEFITEILKGKYSDINSSHTIGASYYWTFKL